jgi:hypothetical protein
MSIVTDRYVHRDLLSGKDAFVGNSINERGPGENRSSGDARKVPLTPDYKSSKKPRRLAGNDFAGDAPLAQQKRNGRQLACANADAIAATGRHDFSSRISPEPI